MLERDNVHLWSNKATDSKRQQLGMILIVNLKRWKTNNWLGFQVIVMMKD